MNLSAFTHGRDNNFNLIRAIAALAVLVTHSFVLATGLEESEPLRDSLGMTMGSIAVDVFFLTSGFLVTASLLNRNSIIEFIWARALRIFPALIGMLIFSVFMIGVYFTTLPMSEYLTSSMTYSYLVKCATLFKGVSYTLPGVFETNPYANAVNGSLWTMPYEVRMYSILAISWILAGKFLGRWGFSFRNLTLAYACLGGIYLFVERFHIQSGSQFPKLFFMFFVGAAFFVVRRHIVLSRKIFFLVVACLFAALLNKDIFFVIYVLSASYILFFVAYVPSGLVRKYKKIGDYSYGLYIYAFPVQQSIAALSPGISVAEMMLSSAAITILLSICSWHLLGKKCLNLKARCVEKTLEISKLFSLGTTPLK